MAVPVDEALTIVAAELGMAVSVVEALDISVTEAGVIVTVEIVTVDSVITVSSSEDSGSLWTLVSGDTREDIDVAISNVESAASEGVDTASVGREVRYIVDSVTVLRVV